LTICSFALHDGRRKFISTWNSKMLPQRQSQLTAQMLNEKGAVGEDFSSTLPVKAGAQTVTASWDWPSPRLWDVRQPTFTPCV
jgi:hypothetical protein